MVENIGYSTHQIKSSDLQSFNQLRKHVTDESRTKSNQSVKFALMNGDKNYSIPVVRRGKAQPSSLKGVARKKAEALEDWYIEFNFVDPKTQISHRKKIREGLNYIKDYQLKELEANKIAKETLELLEEGWNPFDASANQKLLKGLISITIAEAVELFGIHNIEIGTRKKSISSYNSKLKQLVHFYPNTKVNTLEEWQIEHFLKMMQKQKNWTPRTYNAAKTILGVFFNFLVKKKYITQSLTKDISSIKASKETTRHTPISDAHFELVKNHLESNDPFTFFFIMTIHYTCIRPKELRALQLNMIDLPANKITVPSHISKNGLTKSIEIDDQLKPILERMRISDYPQDYYLFSLEPSIFGINPVGENTPYNRFMSCLKALDLLGRDYSLYSIKHRSNIKRYLDGWTPEELMVLNRHASILQTAEYLRALGLFVSLSGKQAPAF